MNFFKLYIGDYQRDTGALSVTEHGAYLLMLQHLYASEKPLPTGRVLYRLLRCETSADRQAVDSVVAQFWVETEEGLICERAMDEITIYRERAEHNRRVGKKGGRPRKTFDENGGNENPEITRTVSKTKPGNNPDGFQNKTEAEPENNPKPEAINNTTRRGGSTTGVVNTTRGARQ